MTSFLKTVCVVLMFYSLIVGQGICSRFQQVPDRCDLNAAPLEQAKCLLRPVKKYANLGDPLSELPVPLDTLIGQPTIGAITADQLKQFLAVKGIPEADVGGSISAPLSKPEYFVIHDTSDFLGDLGGFPGNINDTSWTQNLLARRVSRTVCHVYINRLGQSATAVRFESTTSPVGTKFGSCNPNEKSSFLHIENVQPRIRDRSVRFSNDAIAPTPGLTDAQLERLALIYVVASVRTGKWLIPAYHSSIDLGFPDRHDDPQNFDLDRWAMKLQKVIVELAMRKAAKR